MSHGPERPCACGWTGKTPPNEVALALAQLWAEEAERVGRLQRALDRLLTASIGAPLARDDEARLEARAALAEVA